MPLPSVKIRRSSPVRGGALRGAASRGCRSEVARPMEPGDLALLIGVLVICEGEI